MINKLDQINFFVVDIETTGANNKSDRLTDIAVVHIVDGEIVDTFSSLVNPHKPIPAFIQEMTGITDELVRTAPREKEVLSAYLEFIDKPNAVFVAHNASFDYYFIKNALLRNNENFYDMENVCTVKLSRKLLPAHHKVNLTALTEYFNIPVFMRHRALGDAFATARALIKMLNILKYEHNIDSLNGLKDFIRRTKKSYKTSNTNKNLLLKNIEDMPYSQGIYYLYDKHNKIILKGQADVVKVKLETFFDSEYICSDNLRKIISKVAHIELVETLSPLHSYLILGDGEIDNGSLQLFETVNDVGNLIYIDPNNSRGKTVSIFLFKDGLLADYIDFGKSANTNIMESIIDEVYLNTNAPHYYRNEQSDKRVIRKWLSQEADLGNKFKMEGNIVSVINAIKNYIRSCY